MDASGIAALGVFLLLAFVLPGFCYLLLFTGCFPDLAAQGVHWCAVNKISISYSIAGIGVIGGLLMTSLCWCVELLARTLLAKTKLLKNHYPNLEADKLVACEAQGKGIFHLQVLSGSAIMHLNIGIGSFLMLLAYIYCKFQPYPGFAWKSRMFAVLPALIVANISIAGTMFPRANKAIEAAAAVPVPADGGGAHHHQM